MKNHYLILIEKELDRTATAFSAQCQHRDLLVDMIQRRLGVTDNSEYEVFFLRYFDRMNREEKFHFDQIRAMTEGPLHDGNESIVQIMEENPEVLEEIPSLKALRRHIVFWLNKFEKLFLTRPEMCLVYTGVEDGVPFPKHVASNVTQRLDELLPPDEMR
jgi:hypothetical protein